MIRSEQDIIRPKKLSYAVSLALASLLGSNAALAQDAKVLPKSTSDAEVTQVLVVGTRASQQSAIDRKKNAATAMDSIVAEDVGAFPDRNVGEAISRIAGIALNRGDFGEGVSVNVRGSAADVTRVEIDGQGVQAGGGSDLNGGGDGRGVEFRELSSDLIKSVDVVKGSTADMTEGSLGGGIIIKTRTGLDFKKQYISARVAASQGSLNKKWSPDLNFVFADKFLDGRLGVIANVSKSGVFNEAHSQELTSNSAGYARLADFDNSPQKTFSYNPDLLSKNSPIVNQPSASWPITAAGGGDLNGFTPMEILSKSGAAVTKADCVSAFPDFTAAQLGGISANNQKIAVVHRGNERQSCLNQWNDYTPLNLRNIIKTQKDERLSGDLRLDFKVNDKLTVFAKGSRSARTVNDAFMTFSLGQVQVNPASTVQPGYSGAAFVTNAAGNRVAAPGSGYYTYNTPSFVASNLPYSATSAINIDPSSVVVDANHHVTKYTISDGATTTDQIANTIKTKSQYLQTGGTYRDGGLMIEFFIGDAKSDFQRGDLRTAWGTAYGPATVSVGQSGLWDYSFNGINPLAPTNFDVYGVARPANVATTAVPADANTPAIPAYTINQQPLRTIAPNITFRPKMGDSHEKTAKVDLSWAFPESVPFFTRLKTGFNLRDTSGNIWGGGGFTAKGAIGEFGKAGYVEKIQVPTANLTTSFGGCTNTPGSLGAGGQPCVYGYTPKTNLNDNLSGQIVVTPAEFQNIIAQSMTGPSTPQFFGGAPDRSASLLNNWTQIDVAKAFALAGGKNYNFDCVKECTANDGKVYQQPVSTFSERATAAYVMTDFDLTELPFTKTSLPWGMELNGNFGYRMVRTEVKASGNVTYNSITKTANYNPSAPNAAGGTVTNSITRPTSLNQTDTDIMPVFNLALWPIQNEVVLRYNRAKTVARPPVSKLFPTGTCTYDERRLDTDADMTCDRIGNPALQPQKNINQNLSLEWYPNKDTMFSVGKFVHKGIIGANLEVGRSNDKLFGNTDLVDPQTGRPLSDLEFAYRTYENGPPIKRTGIEFASKSAFTFLPSVLRYTGLDLNYTKLESAASTVVIRDLLTGAVLPARDEPAYSYNASIWYDDGALTARVALQVVAQVFTGIAAQGATNVNNFPNDAGGRITVLPYNPGSPNFRDATRYIDAKIAYRFKNGIEIFAEGRNLGLSTTGNSQAGYAPFADGTPNLLNQGYAGRRIMIGMNFKN